MLTARRLLALVIAFAFTTMSGMAAAPGDGWLITPPDFTVTFPYVDTMVADLKTCCDDYDVKGKGRMLATYWHDMDGQVRGKFTINTVVAVPNKVEGFWTLRDAMDADVRVMFMRKPDGEFAECYLAFQGFDFGIGKGEAVARYALELAIENHHVKPLKGVCDVELFMHGIQNGVPELQFNDLLKTMNVVDGNKTSYMKGFCE